MKSEASRSRPALFDDELDEMEQVDEERDGEGGVSPTQDPPRGGSYDGDRMTEATYQQQIQQQMLQQQMLQQHIMYQQQQQQHIQRANFPPHSQQSQQSQQSASSAQSATSGLSWGGKVRRSEERKFNQRRR